MASPHGAIAPPHSPIFDCTALAVEFLNRETLIRFSFGVDGNVDGVWVSPETDEPEWTCIGNCIDDAEAFLLGVDFAKAVLS